jgi:hypothetical protein
MKDVVKQAYDEIDEFIGKSTKKASEAIEKLTKVIFGSESYWKWSPKDTGKNCVIERSLLKGVNYE